MPLSMKRQRLEMAGIYHQLPPPKRIYYYKGINHVTSSNSSIGIMATASTSTSSGGDNDMKQKNTHENTSTTALVTIISDDEEDGCSLNRSGGKSTPAPPAMLTATPSRHASAPPSSIRTNLLGTNMPTFLVANASSVSASKFGSYAQQQSTGGRHPTTTPSPIITATVTPVSAPIASLWTQKIPLEVVEKQVYNPQEDGDQQYDEFDENDYNHDVVQAAIAMYRFQLPMKPEEEQGVGTTSSVIPAQPTLTPVASSYNNINVNEMEIEREQQRKQEEIQKRVEQEQRKQHSLQMQQLKEQQVRQMDIFKRQQWYQQERLRRQQEEELRMIMSGQSPLVLDAIAKELPIKPITIPLEQPVTSRVNEMEALQRMPASQFRKRPIEQNEMEGCFQLTKPKRSQDIDEMEGYFQITKRKMPSSQNPVDVLNYMTTMSHVLVIALIKIKPNKGAVKRPRGGLTYWEIANIYTPPTAASAPAIVPSIDVYGRPIAFQTPDDHFLTIRSGNKGVNENGSHNRIMYALFCRIPAACCYTRTENGEIIVIDPDVTKVSVQARRCSSMEDMETQESVLVDKRRIYKCAISDHEIIYYAYIALRFDISQDSTKSLKHVIQVLYNGHTIAQSKLCKFVSGRWNSKAILSQKTPSVEQDFVCYNIKQISQA